ncbi:MAG: hypothetical protein ACRC0C_09520 [Gibbsiella quercinecans]|uniref:hypothetical protein n=1 Tax=Gibbsiella quercinecans TaxID=929813 RepID=UPI003F2CE958
MSYNSRVWWCMLALCALFWLTVFASLFMLQQHIFETTHHYQHKTITTTHSMNDYQAASLFAPHSG